MDKSFIGFIIVLRFFRVFTTTCSEGYDSTPHLFIETEGLLAKTDTYIDIQSERDLSLRCEGTEPIAWSTEFDRVSFFLKKF